MGKLQGVTRLGNQDLFTREEKDSIFGVEKGHVRTGNCSVGRLLADPRFSESVLKFLSSTGVEKVKKGVVIRGEAAS